MSPGAKRGVQSLCEHGPDDIGYGVTVILIDEDLRAKDLDSSVASLLRNDKVRLELEIIPVR